MTSAPSARGNVGGRVGCDRRRVGKPHGPEDRQDRFGLFVVRIRELSLIENSENVVEVGVVTGEVFPFEVEQLVAGSHDECRAKLRWPSASLALTVPASKGSGPRKEGIGSGKCCDAHSIRVHNIRCLSVTVEQHGKREGLVLNECLCVPSTTSPDRGDTRLRSDQLFSSISDLTGPLTTRQSAEVS